MMMRSIDKMMCLCVVSLIVAATIPLLTQAAPVRNVRTKRQSSDLDTQLYGAPTELDRQSLLTDDQFVYSFVDPTTGVLTGPGGHLDLAIASNFPATIGHGVSMAYVEMGPCGLDGPLYHPRGTELDYIITGTFLIGFYAELGGRLIVNTVSAGQAMIVPQGAMHFIQNLNCTNSTFVASYNSADPGLSVIANSFFNELPVDIVAASVNAYQTTINNLKASLTASPAIGTQECRQRCGLA